MSKTTDSQRGKIIDFLSSEILGPRNEGKKLDLSKPIIFSSWEESHGPWVDSESGEEIIPIKPRDRYGSGVLEPVQVEPSKIFDDENEVAREEDSSSSVSDSPNIAEVQKLESRSSAGSDENRDHLDIEIRSNKSWLNPRTIGMSFLVESADKGQINVLVSGGTYRPIIVGIKPEGSKKDEKNELSSTTSSKVHENTWYVRESFSKTFIFDSGDMQSVEKKDFLVGRLKDAQGRELNIEVKLLVRRESESKFLCTLSCVNRSKINTDENILYQSTIVAMTKDGPTFGPYPESARDFEMDLDDESALLLYKNYPTYGIGHNAGVEWDRDPKTKISKLKLTSLPSFETPSITPTVYFEDGSEAIIDMRLMADKSRKNEALDELQKLVSSYSNWITLQEFKSETDPDILLKYTKSAKSNIEDCRKACIRMIKGINSLRQDSDVYEAFRLANFAMLEQQYRSRLETRQVSYTGRISISGKKPSEVIPQKDGLWRPFQIAFFLSVIESSANELSEDRDLVDLIFFPTGGGKTEAYLGVAAFVILLKRIKDLNDCGTTVLMRYTLRLLTTQQFLRAASLICALEKIRQKDEDKFGKTPFSIGAWLGGVVTPNSNQKALTALSEMKKRGEDAPNPFLLLRCPWCGTAMGPIKSGINASHDKNFTAGYKMLTTSPKQFKFHCPDIECDFASGLPLNVIDEQIYQFPPTILIGTVDKFAQMGWQEGARSIFGIDADGQRISSAPSLIIQDEFHLISGPLGSLVGIYEGVIEELCTNNVNGVITLPKIISSTATIRRFRAQAEAIYGRKKVSLFPPPCIDASDSFFAVWDRHNDGTLKNGRMYLGVNAPGLGSVQSAQVRVGAALAQAPMSIDNDEERDPWWTNLWFFNSIRELSNTVSLFQSDIPNYLKDMKRRYSHQSRHLNVINELTSRRQSHELPKILRELEESYRGITEPSQRGIWDACLASNIIEVGIDINRLSLMTIVSQPKSTAQYIQVSGRVGRDPLRKPGLVVTIYTSNRPRDLSHFEHFRSYHEKLYAQVEPTSVTPFSAPVIKRALRGAAVSYLRMVIPMGTRPKEVDSEKLKFILNQLRIRAKRLNLSSDDLKILDAEIELILKEWNVYRADEWGGQEGSPNGLLAAPSEDKNITGYRWVIPVSMRNVDASVELEISRKYRLAQMNDEEPVNV
jgi:hypothetical protein